MCSVIYGEIDVQFIDGYGDDLSVVRSARVSFNKNSDYLKEDDIPLNEGTLMHSLIDSYLKYIGYTYPIVERREKYVIRDPSALKGPLKDYFPEGLCGRKLLSFNDYRLIHFICREKHWSTFTHNGMTFRVKVPIFVARQLVKHTVGLTINEVSRRYYDGPVELYKMDYKEANPNKRLEGINFKDRDPEIDLQEERSIKLYNDLVANGVATEDARSVLPLNMFTEFYWSGNLAAFIRVVQLRSHKTTQRQTRIVSDKIKSIIEEKFPVSCQAYFGS